MSKTGEVKHVYFVRHGETHANRNNAVPTRDETLHPDGLLQAEQLTARMQNLTVDAIVTSDFIRAQQSAESLVKTLGLQPEVRPEFGEYVEPAKYHGLQDDGDEVIQFRKRRNALIDTDPDWTEEEEESLTQFFARHQAAKRFLEEHPSDNIVVVSHGFFLMCFFAMLTLDLEKPCTPWLKAAKKFKFSNIGISLVTIQNGEWRFVTLNDHAHFAE